MVHKPTLSIVNSINKRGCLLGVTIASTGVRVAGLSATGVNRAHIPLTVKPELPTNPLSAPTKQPSNKYNVPLSMHGVGQGIVMMYLDKMDKFNE